MFFNNYFSDCFPIVYQLGFEFIVSECFSDSPKVLRSGFTTSAIADKILA